MSILRLMSLQKSYRSLGLLYLDRVRWAGIIDAEAYFDFQYIRWSKDQLMDDLNAGNLPHGLIIVFPDGQQKVVVFGKKEHHYSLKPLSDMLIELSQPILQGVTND